MVLYFTGTGNSRHIAERIAHALGDELVSLNDRIKAGDTTPLAVNDRLVLVTPTYAWRIPRIVEEHLRQTELHGAKKVWFVMDCGSEIGNAAKYNRALCREKGVTYMGTAQIVMPENFIAMFNAPEVEEARQIVARAEPFTDRAIAVIRTGQMFAPPRKNLYDRFMSSNLSNTLSRSKTINTLRISNMPSLNKIISTHRISNMHNSSTISISRRHSILNLSMLSHRRHMRQIHLLQNRPVKVKRFC